MTTRLIRWCVSPPHRPSFNYCDSISDETGPNADLSLSVFVFGASHCSYLLPTKPASFMRASLATPAAASQRQWCFRSLFSLYSLYIARQKIKRTSLHALTLLLGIFLQPLRHLIPTEKRFVYHILLFICWINRQDTLGRRNEGLGVRFHRPSIGTADG